MLSAGANRHIPAEMCSSLDSAVEVAARRFTSTLAEEMEKGGVPKLLYDSLKPAEAQVAPPLRPT